MGEFEDRSDLHWQVVHAQCEGLRLSLAGLRRRPNATTATGGHGAPADQRRGPAGDRGEHRRSSREHSTDQD
eukprot:2851859-Alexandrium_andersonii.AAC.1